MTLLLLIFITGPACYRRGGPLTITDANLVLGRLLPEEFPHIFGLLYSSLLFLIRLIFDETLTLPELT